MNRALATFEADSSTKTPLSDPASPEASSRLPVDSAALVPSGPEEEAIHCCVLLEQED